MCPLNRVTLRTAGPFNAPSLNFMWLNAGESAAPAVPLQCLSLYSQLAATFPWLKAVVLAGGRSRSGTLTCLQPLTRPYNTSDQGQ